MNALLQALDHMNQVIKSTSHSGAQVAQPDALRERAGEQATAHNTARATCPHCPYPAHPFRCPYCCGHINEDVEELGEDYYAMIYVKECQCGTLFIANNPQDYECLQCNVLHCDPWNEDVD